MTEVLCSQLKAVNKEIQEKQKSLKDLTLPSKEELFSASVAAVLTTSLKEGPTGDIWRGDQIS